MIFKANYLCTLLLSTFLTCAQSQTKQLDAEAYKADLDTMIRWITLVSPIYEINDRLKQEDFLKAAAEYRRKIKPGFSDREFLVLVNSILNLIQDPHASMLTNKNFIAPSLVYPSDTNGLGQACLYWKKVRSEVLGAKVGLQLPIKYVHGCYVVYYPFTFGGETIDSGYVVETINGKQVDQFIKQAVPEIPALKYDLKNKYVYYESFYKLRRLYAEDSTMSIVFSGANARKTLRFHITDTLSYDRKLRYFDFNANDNDKKVLYFDSLALLYIRMPLMSDNGFYRSEILKYRGKPLKKVVFDVRGNGGGMDWVWSSCLKLLIRDSEVFLPFYFGIKDNPYMRGRMKGFLHESVFGMQQSSITNTLLPGHSYYTFRADSDNFYSADSLSLRFKGKIYILCQGYEYSSTGNFIDLAGSNEKIVSVGMSTGLFGGTEFSPLPFVLPNSKLAFRLAATLDFKDVRRLEDFYHNYIEVPYTYSTQDLYNFARSGEEFSRSFLLHKDPLFKKVLELK